MDNIALIGVIILVMWLIAIGYYFIVSRQQRSLAEEIKSLRDLLEESDDEIGQGQ